MSGGLLPTALKEECLSYCPLPSGPQFSWAGLLLALAAALLLGWCRGILCCAGAWLAVRRWAAVFLDRTCCVAPTAPTPGAARRLEGYRA